MIVSRCQIPIFEPQKGRSDGASPVALIGALLAPLKSPLPVLLSAWLMVSTLYSAAMGELAPSEGLPAPLSPRLGLASIALPAEVETLVGGEVPKPGLDIGDRTGEGDRGAPRGG